MTREKLIGAWGKYCIWAGPTWYRKKWKVWYYWRGGYEFSEKYDTREEAMKWAHNYLYERR